MASDTPVQMPRPDEKQLKVAVKKSQSVKPLPQQAAFAAQNLEDMVHKIGIEFDLSIKIAGYIWH